MSHLQDLMSPDCVIARLEAKETEEAIAEMVGRLIDLGQLSREDKEFVTQAVMEREEQIGTGVGSGVAIPHARISGLSEPLAVFARSEEGVDFVCPDCAPAKLICLLLVPEETANLHLQTLAELAKVFRQSARREMILNAVSPEEVIHAITAETALKMQLN